jgi:ABC-type transport system involved in multi-copper enzyme maturation permease subunit
MMSRLLTIARWTLVEALRERLLYVVLLFAALLVAGSCVLTPLAPGAQRKVVVDLGLASMNLLGVLVILLSGAGLVRREIERRSLDVLLAHPVSRLEYVAGKWLGLVATLFVLVFAMSIVFATTLAVSEIEFRAAYGLAIGGTILELTVVASLAVLFSTFTSPTLAALFTLALFGGGHWADGIGRMAVATPHADLVGLLRWTVPALGLFDFRGDAVHGAAIAPARVVTAVAYAAFFAVTTLYAASVVFRRRDLR